MDFHAYALDVKFDPNACFRPSMLLNASVNANDANA